MEFLFHVVAAKAKKTMFLYKWQQRKQKSEEYLLHFVAFLKRYVCWLWFLLSFSVTTLG